MSTLAIIILGIVQGLTEFLPVSSSGHLLLIQHLFGIVELEKYIIFDVVCHLGTLCAIFLIFWKEILIIVKYDWKRIFQVFLGTLPLFFVIFLIKPIKQLFTIDFLGYFFFITAAFLYAATRFGVPPEKTKEKITSWKDPLIIGFAQLVAILPGVSRSGTTISTARILGWKPSEAVLFSFLLAIPAILGAAAFEFLEIFTEEISNPLTLWQYMIGFGFSFGAGCFSLTLLRKLAAKDRFMYFVYYCITIGMITIILTHFN